jgi:hypothetical protein
MSRRFAPWRGSRFPSRAGASGSHHLPWALPRILQVRAKGKRVGDGNNPGVGRGSGVACSKGASNAFIRARRASAIAARTAGRRRGSGRVGRPSSDTGRRLPARRNATSKAGVTGSARKPGKHQIQRQLSRPRGSSLRNIYFEHACDRPGCYEGFAPERRSPLQRFCSQACRRALERVEERERRWKQARI